MVKGKGKCTVCGNDEFAVGRISLHVTVTEEKDFEYLIDPYIHACTNCGYMQMTSKKVFDGDGEPCNT